MVWDMDGAGFSILVTTLVLGLACGAVFTWLLMRARHTAATARLAAEAELLRTQVQRLSATTEESQELAMTLAPLSSSLARVERQVEQLERDGATQWGRLDAQLASLASTDEALRRQTAELAGALRSGGVRGAWGEVQLRRVIELAGLLERVDFMTQVSGTNDEGAAVRPDAVVYLPGGKHVVIDAKAPLAGDDVGQARALKSHVAGLTAKRYWTAFDPSPELVVCFVPTEGLLAAACRADPELIEQAMSKRVVIATPTTLMAILRTVALTWQQDALVGNANQVVQLGRQLHERLVGLGSATAKLGRTLNRAVVDYNALVETTERQVLARARRLGELGITSMQIESVPQVEAVARDAIPDLERIRELSEPVAGRRYGPESP